MSKAVKVKALIIERIRDGSYPVGAYLPSIRDFASQTGVNANTVALAYRDLAAEGVIKGERGRGTTVIQYPEIGNQPGVISQVQRDLRRIVERALNAGMGPTDLRSLLEDAVSLNSVFEPLRLGFVECNQYDASDVSAVLTTILGLSVEPIVLAELEADTNTYLMRSDLIVTVPNHAESVHRVVDKVTPVIVINSMPTTSTMVRLSRIGSNRRVATLASNHTAAQRLCDVVRVYARDVEVHPFVMDSIDDMAVLLDMDVLVHSHAANEFVGLYCKQVEAVTARFEPEVNSLEFLKARLKDLFPDHFATEWVS